MQSMNINTYIIGDNLENLKQIATNSIHLSYIDPPYCTGRNFHHFSDKFENIKTFTYEFLKPRLQEIHRILCKDGNIVVHVEPKISHYVRIILDEIFGIDNFKNEIVWKSGGNKKSTKQLARFHDTILVYSKSKKSIYNPLYIPYDDVYKQKLKWCEYNNMYYSTSAAHNSQPDVNPRHNLRYEWNGHLLQWYVSLEKMQNLHDANRLEYNASGIPRFKKYMEEMSGIPIRDLWTDITQIQHNEKLDYATQKPIKLLERIIEIYSNDGNIVLDAFAGSGTTGRACILKNRKYILLDINEHGKRLFEQSLISLQ